MILIFLLCLNIKSFSQLNLFKFKLREKILELHDLYLNQDINHDSIFDISFEFFERCFIFEINIQ